VWNDPRALNTLTAACMVAATLLIVGTAAWRLAQLDSFAVKQIDVTGDARHLTPEQVQAVVFLHLRGTFFTMNLESAREAFRKLPWVRRVEVRRRWPDRIEFDVEEHRALARWGNTALVNEYGEVFEGASNSELPVFSGPASSAPEMVERYFELQRTLESVGRAIVELRLSERRAWSLTLEDGTLIELGREDVARRLVEFVAAYQRVAGQIRGRVALVDLRYANGFAVRVRNNKSSEARA
jgi:cell division protein FtsQ